MDMATSSSSSDGNKDARSFTGRMSTGKPESNSEGNNSKQKQKHQPSLRQEQQRQPPNGFAFDILAWYPKYQSCQLYFVDHSQHDVLVQAFAAFINILLPFQRNPPIYSSRGAHSFNERAEEISNLQTRPIQPQDRGAIPVSLVPYIRRLVATGMDVPQILHGFFGNDWQHGIGPQREAERRNFLFAAKSGGWSSVKQDYDMLPFETVPFLKPLMGPYDEEIVAAEKAWSEWLAMEDWMVGSRAPEEYQDLSDGI